MINFGDRATKNYSQLLSLNIKVLIIVLQTWVQNKVIYRLKFLSALKEHCQGSSSYSSATESATRRHLRQSSNSHWIQASFSSSFWNKICTLVHGNKAKQKRPGLALLRCKMTFQIFGLGLIAVQNDFSNFRAWPYCGAKWLSKFSGLALLRCKFAWPYCRAPV